MVDTYRHWCAGHFPWSSEHGKGMKLLRKRNPFRITALSLVSALVAVGALTGAATSASAQTTAVRMDHTCTTSLGPRVQMTVWVVGGLPDEGAGLNTVAR